MTDINVVTPPVAVALAAKPTPLASTDYTLVSTSATKPAVTKPVDAVKHKAPQSASAATRYFAKKEAEKAKQAEANREYAKSQMPIGVKYFTAKAEEEKAAREAKIKKLSEEKMSDAARHFKKIEGEKEKGAFGVATMGEMPAAIQHFAAKTCAEKDKKRQSLKATRENLPDVPGGLAYFNIKHREEKARKVAEIKARKENPPPSSVATAHFQKKNKESQLETARFRNEPATNAIEYFTVQAKDEKARKEGTAKNVSERGGDVSVASKYFAKLRIKKEEEAEPLRSHVRERNQEALFLLDYIIRLDKETTESNTRTNEKFAEHQMPAGLPVSERTMSEAAKHFKRTDGAKEEARERASGRGRGERERKVMSDRAAKEKKRKSVRVTPPEMTAGQEYLTLFF